MDTFAHALWALAAAKFANFMLESKKKSRKEKSSDKPIKKLNLWLSAFFGIAPDIFSFGIYFAFAIVSFIIGPRNTGGFHDSWNSTDGTITLIRGIVSNMYDITHSLAIVLIVFGIIYVWKKRIVWEMLGWPLHILIDIPTHSYRFYPTPFLWPLSDYRFNGISWGQRWFMILNYSLLTITYIAILYVGWKKTRNTQRIKEKK